MKEALKQLGRELFAWGIAATIVASEILLGLWLTGML